MAPAGRPTTIRAYRPSDLERIRELHERQAFEYQFPDLNDPVFAVGCIAENETGRALTAAFLKITAEAYLFLDPEYGTPRERWQILLQVHEAVRWQARDMGLSEVTCWIPPNLGKGFERRLRKLGWQSEPSNWKRAAYHIRPVVPRENF